MYDECLCESHIWATWSDFDCDVGAHLGNGTKERAIVSTYCSPPLWSAYAALDGLLAGKFAEFGILRIE
jgi:hypothetical protein